ncbi:redoxin family protein [Psychrobacillus sp. L4]|uniref:redoxin family protein n=1 Tax=Psychrobacillus sp. L4 TaxID=3236892 RepID=UPI0036F33496
MIKKIVSLMAITFMLASCSSEQQPSADQAPTFELKDVAGNTHNLSDYEGKKVYLKFWASWCSICLSGLEEINTLAGEDNDFVVLTVVSPGYNNEKNTASFIKWFKGVEGVSNLTVLLDEKGDIAKQFNVRGYPTSAFISSDGSLVKTQPGHLNNEQIKDQFKKIH